MQASCRNSGNQIEKMGPLTNDFLGSLSILSLFPLAGVIMCPVSTRFRFTLGSPSALSGACLFVADTDVLEVGGPK